MLFCFSSYFNTADDEECMKGTGDIGPTRFLVIFSFLMWIINSYMDISNVIKDIEH